MIWFSNVFIFQGLTDPLGLDYFDFTLESSLVAKLMILFVTHIRISLLKVRIVRAVARIALLEWMLTASLTCRFT